MSIIATLFILAAITMASPAAAGHPAPLSPPDSISWRIADMASGSEVVLARGSERRVLRLAGLRQPLPSTQAERRWHRELLARTTESWIGMRVTRVHQRPEGWEVEFEGGHNVAVESIAAGLAWAHSTDPALRAAERQARAQQRGVWSATAWHELAARATEPVVIPTPGQAQRPRRGVADRADSRGVQPWIERLNAFEQALEEIASTADERAESQF